MMDSGQKVLVRGADGQDHPLTLVRLERGVAYCCAEEKYKEAITHPDACIEVGFPLRDVKMKEAAN
jgi:alpha-D-ribose 1-methylphosphonate 5-phosphate C-P lyase